MPQSLTGRPLPFALAVPLAAAAALAVSVAAAAALAFLAGPASAGDAAPQRFIVSVDPTDGATRPQAAAVSAVAATVADADAAVVSAFTVGDEGFVVVEDTADAGGEVATALSAAGYDVAEDVRYTVAQTPTDPLWDAAWGRTLGSPRLWSASTGEGTVVAVLDTGVNLTMELTGRRLPGQAFTDDGNPTWADLSPTFHGTKSAEAAASAANNAIGSAGGCWDCEVLPVRVLSQQAGWGSDIAQGMVWAVDNGADVLTMSFSAPAPDPATEAAAAYVADAGVAMFAAAGNYANDKPRWPADYDEVVGVAGLHTPAPDAPRLHDLSSWGSAQIAAPFCTNLNRGYYCGTSAATPIVAGHAASLIGAGFAAADVADALVATAAPVADMPFGHMDAASALTALRTTPDPQPLCDDAPQLSVVQGTDRFATAALIADLRVAAHGTPSTVVVAAGDPFVDAIAAGPAVGDDAVVLLTRTDRLPEATRTQLRLLNPEQIMVAGGTAVVSPAVEAALADYADDVVRVAGPDRSTTSAALAAYGPTDLLRVADGRNMPRALTAAGWAGALGEGLLLDAGGTARPDAVSSFIEEHRPRQVVVQETGDQGDRRLHDLLAPLSERNVLPNLTAADPAATGKFASGGALLLTVRDSVVDAVPAAALSAVSGHPVFVPEQDWHSGGLGEAQAVIAALNPDEVWLLGQSGNLDPAPLLCE